MVFTQTKGRFKEAIETQHCKQQLKTLDLSGIVVSVDARKLTPGNSMRTLTHPQHADMQGMDGGITDEEMCESMREYEENMAEEYEEPAEQVQAEQKIK